MKLEHIVALAVRLFSIAVAIYALRNGISLVPFFNEQGWEIASYAYLTLMAGLLLLSLYLWYFPLTVAGRLVTFKGDGITEAGSASAKEIQVVGFTILGMYLLFNVISDVVYWLIIWFIGNRNSNIDVTPTADQVSSMFATGVELVFAVTLLLGAAGISRVINKLVQLVSQKLITRHSSRSASAGRLNLAVMQQ